MKKRGGGGEDTPQSIHEESENMKSVRGTPPTPHTPLTHIYTYMSINISIYTYAHRHATCIRRHKCVGEVPREVVIFRA